jgi:transcriptional regulator with XRE-family HTH domain
MALLKATEMELGSLIRSMRQSTGVTVATIAATVGCTAQPVYSWERGETRPQAGKIGPLAQLLGIPPAELARMCGKPTPPSNVVPLRQEFAPGNAGHLDKDAELIDVIIRRLNRTTDESVTKAEVGLAELCARLLEKKHSDS